LKTERPSRPRIEFAWISRVVYLMSRPFSLFHDGLWFTCPVGRATVARVKDVIKEILKNSVRFSVPPEMGLI
jgi:hypothetical protein